MTPEERQEIVQIVLDTLNEIGASVENPDEVPTVTTINDETTTMPFINRVNGAAAGYVQITVANLATIMAGRISAAKLDSITEEQFNAIFYPSNE